MELAPGAALTAKLTLVEQLGAGGMGSVWIAEHHGLGARVAVKLMAGRETDPAARSRFAREAALAARIASPHVVRMLDHGESSDGTPYIAMELLRGETLAARIARAGRLELREVATVVAQVGAALSAAHALSIVHRDITPANVLLVESDLGVFAKVLDFGVAKDLAPGGEPGLTTTGAAMGTPQYMSPEQLLGIGRVDHRADLWALGAVAYHALTGKRPFEGATVAALGVAVNDGEFTPATEVVADLPPALDAWFGRALCVAPEHRFSSAREQARAFVEAAGLKGMLAVASAGDDTPRTQTSDRASGPRPDTTTEPISPALPAPIAASRPRWLAAALVAACAVIGVAAIAATSSPTQRAEPPGAMETGTAIAQPPDHRTAEFAGVDEAATAVPEVAEAPASATPPLRAPAARSASQAAAPPPSARGASSASPRGANKPAYCATDDGFDIDDKGHYRLKPECL